MSRLPLKIIGVGHYLPKRVVPSSEVEQLCGLRSGWIGQKTGVQERRWVNGETSTYMGAEAAREAVKDAGITFKDIDLILNASGTQAQAIPDGAHLLQRELGMADSGSACLSVHTTCLSFLTAMDVSACFLATGRYKTILIVSADIASIGLNFKEPESASLFGDAAAAVVVTVTPPGEASGVSSVLMEGYSSGADYTRVSGGGTNRPPFDERTTREDFMFHMEGPRVYRLARQYSAPFLEKLRPGLSSGLGTIRQVIPHQASIFAIRALRKYGVPDEKVSLTIDKYGNCVAASLPITLYDTIKSDRIQRGDEVLLIGTGAGLCLGGMILTY
ncbi:MAG: 3-oxoacyl-[acyl-carrier-protein] synthase 3 [Candidatus Hydrogenedentota bacterium]